MKLKKQLLIATLWTSALGLGATGMLLAGFYLYLSPTLPPVDSIKDYHLQTPLRIYSADKKLIGEFGEKRRKPIKYEDIPQDFINALLAAEDEDFYKHKGVSIKGLVRAATQLILTGRKASGGSTLTMQLTRHVFLSLNRTFSRKFNEILLAYRIEKELSKEEILELYVNLMFLGKRAYGIEAAAEVYYGKNINELSLAQQAMIVGVFKGPSTLNPLANPERAQERRNYVLDRMLKLEFINQTQHQSAIAEPVSADHHENQIGLDAPYVAEMARKEAVDRFGADAYTRGYKVYTTVRSDWQARAQQAIANGLLLYDARHGYRGPEQELDPSSLSSTVDTQPDYSSWQQALQTIPTYGGLVPAAVITLRDQSLEVLFANGETVEIGWDQGLADTQMYLTENSRGPKAKTASDIAKIGDVIRLRKDQHDRWLFSQVPAAQASLVSLNPANGAILSLVGGFDFNYSNFNRATQAQRQPGSNFKPFIYAIALENGLTPATLINDSPIVFDDKQLESTWRPENANRKFYGPTRLREALYRSINLVSIRVLERIGINNTIESLEKFGFDPEALPKDLTLALGTHALTPLDIATGYAIFANGGYKIEPYLIESIEDFNHEILYQALPLTVCDPCAPASTPIDTPTQSTSAEVSEKSESSDAYQLPGDAFELSPETKGILGILEPKDYPRAPQILSSQVAYIMDSMLQDVVRRGTAFKAWEKLKRPDIGGKTGTTNGPLDAWFSGYHPNIVTTTWIGFDQNLPLGRREYGGSAALPIWLEFMELALEEQPIVTRIQPQGIVSVRIDPKTGRRAKVGNPKAIFEIFRKENLPELEEANNMETWNTEETINEELF